MVHETLNKLIGASLLCRGKSYEEIAEEAGVSVRTLYQLRSGSISNPHRRVLDGLSRAIGCSTDRVRAAILTSHLAAQVKS